MTDLTPEQLKFIEECEREFADRFSETDAEFMEHCDRPTNPPPILDDWQSQQNSFRRGRGGYNNYHRHDDQGGNRNRYHRDERDDRRSYNDHQYHSRRYHDDERSHKRRHY